MDKVTSSRRVEMDETGKAIEVENAVKAENVKDAGDLPAVSVVNDGVAILVGTDGRLVRTTIRDLVDYLQGKVTADGVTKMELDDKLQGYVPIYTAPSKFGIGVFDLASGGGSIRYGNVGAELVSEDATGGLVVRDGQGPGYRNITVKDPTADAHAATKKYVDEKAYAVGSGDFRADGSVTMSGNLDMGRNRLVNLDAPQGYSDAVRKQDLDLKLGKAEGSLMFEPFGAGKVYVYTDEERTNGSWLSVDADGRPEFRKMGVGLVPLGVGEPVKDTDAATKAYVDSNKGEQFTKVSVRAVYREGESSVSSVECGITFAKRDRRTYTIMAPTIVDISLFRQQMLHETLVGISFAPYTDKAIDPLHLADEINNIGGYLNILKLENDGLKNTRFETEDSGNGLRDVMIKCGETGGTGSLKTVILPPLEFLSDA